MDLLLAIAGMARSTYYYHISRKGRPDKYLQVREQIQDIYHAHKGRYGYRRMRAELMKRGYLLNHKTVLKLMRSMGMLSCVRPKKYQSFRGTVGTIADNLLKRDFTTRAPNEKWATDVTEFKVCGEKRFLSALLDLHSQDIVGYTVTTHPRLSMTLRMLDQAFALFPEAGEGLVIHSDQGWQYQHKDYCDKLSSKGIRQSMSRKGNCLDNAVMESFFGILKSELLYNQEFTSIEHLEHELHAYMHYYNHERIKMKLDGLPPSVYRSRCCQKS